MRCFSVFALLLCAACARARPVPDASFVALFDGRSLAGWTTFLESHGAGADPERVFQARNGVLHVYADRAADRAPFGYVATTREYGDFHLRLEYRWGEKRFAPRDRDKRDAGVLYRVVPRDEVWPTGIECQIQEGDTGDLWTIDARVAVQVDGAWIEQGGTNEITRVVKRGDHERPGWNQVEVIARGDEITHIVNGAVVNRASRPRRPDRDRPGAMQPMVRGRIALQAEGAEILYRKIDLAEL